MKIYYCLLLTLLSCNPVKKKDLTEEFLYLPDKYELYKQKDDTLVRDLKDKKYTLYIPIDVSCSTCLTKFSSIKKLTNTLKSYENVLQVVPICFSKNNDFEAFKYLNEADEIERSDLVMILDLEGDFYKLNNTLMLNQCILANNKNKILLLGDYLDNVEQVPQLIKILDTNQSKI